MDVRVDGGPQDGTILVTWIPSSTHGLAARQAPVTGYAVFADGKRVTDVDSPTSKNHFNYHHLAMHEILFHHFQFLLHIKPFSQVIMRSLIWVALAISIQS